MIERTLKKAKITLFLTFISLIISGIALLLIPYLFNEAGTLNAVLAYVVAGCFWGGIAASLLFTLTTKKVLGHYYERLTQRNRIKSQSAPGILSFSLQLERMILYFVTAAGLILIITDILFGYIHERMMFTIVFITFLSFAIHCVIDGKYYKVYKMIKESVDYETSH